MLSAEQHAVEANPFSPAQRSPLHVVGTLNERYSELAQLAIAAAVLKRRQHYGIGADVYQTLYVRCHGFAEVGNLAARNILVQLRQVDVLQVANTLDLVVGPQFVYQSAVYRGVNHGVGYRGAYHVTVRQVVRQFLLPGHQYVAVQRACGVPWVGDACRYVAVVLLHGQQFGVLHFNRQTVIAGMFACHSARCDGEGDDGDI